GRTGLMGWWPFPLSSWTARSLVRRLRYGLRRTRKHVGGLGLPGGGGTSPAAILGSQPGPPSPSPGSISKPTPADHQCGCMMARHRDRRLGLLIERILPVAPAHTEGQAGSTAPTHRPAWARPPTAHAR